MKKYSHAEVIEIKRFLQNFIRKNDIVDFNVFMDLVERDCTDDQYYTATINTAFFSTYIESRKRSFEGTVVR